MIDPKTGIHEPTVTIPWWMDCRKRTPYISAKPLSSFQHFRWACGHTGPAYCLQCHESSKVRN